MDQHSPSAEISPSDTLELLRESVNTADTQLSFLRRSFFKAILKKSTGLFLDMNGSSIMDEPIHAAIGVQVLKEHGYPEATIEWWFKYLGKGHDKVWSIVQEELAPQNRSLTLGQAEFKHLCLGLYAPTIINMKPQDRVALRRPGLLELIEEAKKLNLPVAVVSGNEEHAVQLAVDAIQIREHVDLVISHTRMIDMGLKGKPEPDCYRYAARKLGVNPIHGLAVEDSGTGFESARRAGMKVIGIHYAAAGQKPYADTPFNISDDQHLGDAFNHIDGIGGRLRALYNSDNVDPSRFLEDLLEQLEQVESGDKVKRIFHINSLKDTMAQVASPQVAKSAVRGGARRAASALVLKPQS